METVGIRALKQNASAVVARAVAGESITITDRGRAVARLTPLASTTIDTLITSGRARPPLRPLADLPGPVGVGELSSVVQRGRDEERY
ncbi:MAG: type II toxin-antitoxin system Phd/YefM family antitoxin [Microbacterium sp.]|uniref:type II toxin-antitoxin system Phd/YefM family antitoxin n=1 Tax=Microbacterium sp. TaxID=51671 RepID=UPI003A895E2D